MALDNHTDCHCIPRTSGIVQHQSQIITPKPIPIEQRQNCPGLFEMILGQNNDYRCDCSSGNAACENFKSGVEHFSFEHRK